MFNLTIFSHYSNAQNKPNSGDRTPAVAGQFYPADSAKLSLTLKELFNCASPKSATNVFAIICPHAGYVYSGVVAASSFNQLDPDKEYETIFVIGASHKFLFDGASVYNKGNFITPLGPVSVDTALASKIVNSDKVFQCNPDYHNPDHCIEVQLPFLQYHLKKKFKIVPILVGTRDLALCKKIAAGLKPYLNDKNLFVLSTDFSHYPAYSNAVAADKITADAITSNDPMKLIKAINTNFDKNIPNLETSLCGFDAVISFLYMTENIKGVTIKEINYKNSGDALRDSTAESVVGYWSLAFCNDSKNNHGSEDDEFKLSEKDKEELLKIARTTLDSFIIDKKIPATDTTGISSSVKQKCGAFVTLKIDGELRGCIGSFNPEIPLYKVIQNMTISSSTLDRRFNPVKKEEIDSISIEISVLSPLKKITSSDEIVLGKHGIYMKKGGSSGTFLPQVATETGWTTEEFLGHCARDKAGIGWDGWKKADLYVYTAIVFGEKDK